MSKTFTEDQRPNYDRLKRSMKN